MIYYYDFTKNVKENNNIYIIELVIPHSFDNFVYKVYGDDGFVQNGRFTFYKNISVDNIVVISVNKIQNLFFNIKLKNNIEYFDFINMSNMLINKNIKLNIKKIPEDEIDYEEDEEEEDDEEDDEDEEDDNDDDEEDDNGDENNEDGGCDNKGDGDDEN